MTRLFAPPEGLLTLFCRTQGIPREHVEAALARGTDVVLRLDVQGAATVRQLMPGCVSIFLVSSPAGAATCCLCT